MVGCLAREAISLEAFRIIFAINAKTVGAEALTTARCVATRISFKTKTPQQHRV